MKITIRKKLVLGFAVLLLLLVVFGTIVLINVSQIDRQFARAINDDAQAVTNAKELLRLVDDMETSRRSFCITTHEKLLEPYYKAAAAFTELMAKQKKLVCDRPEQIMAVETIECFVRLWHEQVADTEIAMARKESKAANNAKSFQIESMYWMDIHPETLGDVVLSNEDKTGKKILDLIKEEIGHFIDAGEVSIADRYISTSQSTHNVIYWTAVAVILSIPFGLLIAFVITRSITQPVLKLVAANRMVAKGDLSQKLEVKSNDEIGELAQSFNHMVAERRCAEEQLNAANQQLIADEQQLKAANQRLRADEERLKLTNQRLVISNHRLQTNERRLKTLTDQLVEQTRELDCLYGITKLATESSRSQDDILIEAVGLVPQAWQYPEIACARIVVDGREFSTDNFRQTEWRQFADIMVSDNKVGFVEVCYLEEKPVLYEGPFLKEERSLIIAVGRQLGNILDNKRAHEALVASNRELKDFVYIASHDLREPLRKISSFGELLAGSLRGKLEGDDHENLLLMIDGANRMTEMIEGLLLYSRVATKEAPLKTVDLNEVVGQLKELELAVLLEETGANIEIQNNLPEVQGNPAQIRQLMQNLIANGIKFMPAGRRPHVQIRVKQTDDETVKIEVQDNGIGIEEQYFEEIFTMFKRLHSRKKYSGSGIGLAVCKKIVKRHGGQIGVESNYGEGATFWFTLRLAHEAVAVL